jgi:hypothetical protein
VLLPDTHQTFSQKLKRRVEAPAHVPSKREAMCPHATARWRRSYVEDTRRMLHHEGGPPTPPPHLCCCHIFLGRRPPPSCQHRRPLPSTTPPPPRCRCARSHHHADTAATTAATAVEGGESPPPPRVGCWAGVPSRSGHNTPTTGEGRWDPARRRGPPLAPPWTRSLRPRAARQ